MPTFRYNGPAGYYYPTLGATPVPGEHFDHDDMPTDGRWLPVEAAPPATDSAPEAHDEAPAEAQEGEH